MDLCRIYALKSLSNQTLCFIHCDWRVDGIFAPLVSAGTQAAEHAVARSLAIFCSTVVTSMQLSLESCICES